MGEQSGSLLLQGRHNRPQVMNGLFFLGGEGKVTLSAEISVCLQNIRRRELKNL